MLRKEFIIGILAAILSFGLAGTAFSADADMVGANDIGSEAGNWQLVPNTQNVQMGQVANSAVGSEAGNWQYSFDSPETNAERAASRYDYDRESLSAIGTEGGALDNSLENQMRTRCSDC